MCVRVRRWILLAGTLACLVPSAASAVGASPSHADRTRAIGVAVREPLPCGFRDDKTITVDGQTMYLQVVSTNATRERGLSGRSCIEADEAMLFVFPGGGYWGFWMKEMNFPLDMVWLSASGKVVKIERDLQPSTYPEVFTNATPAQYVLEMAAGRAASLGLRLGSSLSL